MKNKTYTFKDGSNILTTGNRITFEDEELTGGMNLDMLNMSNAGQTLLAAYYYYYKNEKIKALHFARKTIHFSPTKSVRKSAVDIVNDVLASS
jgi:hypothetical protein